MPPEVIPVTAILWSLMIVAAFWACVILFESMRVRDNQKKYPKPGKVKKLKNEFTLDEFEQKITE